MINFLFGIVAGVVLSTVGFNSVAQMGDNVIQEIQSFVKSSTK